MGDGLIKELMEGKKYLTDLITVIVLTLIGAVGAWYLPDGSLLRIILGIPMLLFFPGWVLVSVLWPRERLNKTESIDIKSLDLAERVTLSFGISITIVALLGLALNYSTGINLETSLLAVTIFILAMSVIAYIIRMKLTEEERFAISINLSFHELASTRKEKLMTGVIVVLLIISACATGYMLLTPQVDNIYSELYILDSNHTTESFPTNISVNSTALVHLGIVNHEYKSVTYEIVAGINDTNGTALNSDWDNTINLSQTPWTSRTIILEHGDSFEDSFNFTLNSPGEYKIIWLLKINGEETNYEVHMWVEVE